MLTKQGLINLCCDNVWTPLLSLANILIINQPSVHISFHLTTQLLRTEYIPHRNPPPLHPLLRYITRTVLRSTARPSKPSLHTTQSPFFLREKKKKQQQQHHHYSYPPSISASHPTFHSSAIEAHPRLLIALHSLASSPREREREGEVGRGAPGGLRGDDGGDGGVN